MHYASFRAEESLSIFAIQKERDQAFEFHISNIPKMRPSVPNKSNAQAIDVEEEL